MTVVGFVLYGSMVLLPIMLQTLLGYPPLQAGIAMAPRGDTLTNSSENFRSTTIRGVRSLVRR